ncbi:MAG: hypothetical protein V4691_07055 [Pseudomonadota bacterium]
MVPAHKRRFCYVVPTSGTAGHSLVSIEKSHSDTLGETPPPVEKQV